MAWQQSRAGHGCHPLSAVPRCRPREVALVQVPALLVLLCLWLHRHRPRVTLVQQPLAAVQTAQPVVAVALRAATLGQGS